MTNENDENPTESREKPRSRGGAGRELEDDVLILDDSGQNLSSVELLEEITAEAARITRERNRNRDAGPPPSENDPDPAEIESLQGEIEKVRDELAAARESEKDARERQVRALADYDNLRRRTEREKVEQAKVALGNVLREILPVLDNFSAALQAQVPKAGVEDQFRSGVELIARQLGDVLGRLGLTEVPGEGAPFDPAHHEAVMRSESTEVPHNTVAQVLRKGYLLKDRLLRPAMVRVAVRPENEAADGGTVSSTGEPSEPAS